MSFTLRLAPDLLAVEAGATTPLSLNIASRGEAAEKLEIQVEGLDPEWIATPEPVFTVEPGEDHVERIFFKPGRVSESLAGNYPFVVRARSLDTGEAKTAAGVLQIKPYNHIAMEIGPKKGYYSRARKHNVFQVTVINLGNTEHTVQLFGNDPEDECAFDFEQETFVLGPGQSKIVNVAVTPKTERTFSSSRLFGFSISLRSTSAPSVSASAQAQLEQRPIISLGYIAFGVMVLLVLLAWFALLPKPATVTLTAIPSQVIQGDSVHISWDSKDATRVQVTVNGKVWQDDVPSNPAGLDYKTTTAGPLTIEATPYKDQTAGKLKRQVITVDSPPFVEEPKIDVFEPMQKTVNVGENAILKYKFGGEVKSAKLSPTQQDVDLNLSEIQVTPTQVGVNEYTLIAYNSAGKLVSKKVSIMVKEKIDVTIDTFDITPPIVANVGDAVTVSWKVSKSTKVQLSVNGVAMDVAAEGSRAVSIASATTITLIATDDKSHRVTRTKTIRPPLTSPPPDANPTPPPAGAGAPVTGGQP